MATVVHLGGDKRGEIAGRGVGKAIEQEITKRQAEQKQKDLLDLLTEEAANPGQTTPQEFLRAGLAKGLFNSPQEMMQALELSQNVQAAKDRNAVSERNNMRNNETSRANAQLSAITSTENNIRTNQISEANNVRNNQTSAANNIRTNQTSTDNNIRTNQQSAANTAANNATSVANTQARIAASSQGSAPKAGSLEAHVGDFIAANGLDASNPGDRLKATIGAMSQRAAAGQTPSPTQTAVRDLVVDMGGDPNNAKHRATARRFKGDSGKATKALEAVYKSQFGADLNSMFISQKEHFLAANEKALNYMTIQGGGLNAAEAARRAFDEVKADFPTEDPGIDTSNVQSNASDGGGNTIKDQIGAMADSIMNLFGDSGGGEQQQQQSTNLSLGQYSGVDISIPQSLATVTQNEDGSTNMQLDWQKTVNYLMQNYNMTQAQAEIHLGSL